MRKKERLAIDIVAHNGKHLYEFLGYLLDEAGELRKIYEERCRESKEENEKLIAAYQKKMRELKETGDFSTKVEMPPELDLPQKNYEEMFEEYLKSHEMSLLDPFHITLFEKQFTLRFKQLDHITPERIANLPNAVFFLVAGDEAGFKAHFSECNDMKQAFFMHLFFGTERVYFMYYFSYRDRLLRHEECQARPSQLLIEQVNALFDYISTYGLTKKASSTETAAESC